MKNFLDNLKDVALFIGVIAVAVFIGSTASHVVYELVLDDFIWEIRDEFGEHECQGIPIQSPASPYRLKTREELIREAEEIRQQTEADHAEWLKNQKREDVF